MSESSDLDQRDFLGRLTDEERTDLGRISSRKKVSRGAYLFREGDVTNEVLVIRAGRVKVCGRRANRELIMAVLDAGTILGELSALDGAPRSATVVALEPVEVDVIGHDDFTQFLTEHPRVSGELLRLVADRLRNASARQLEFGTMDTLARLCASLTQLGERYGRSDGGRTEIAAPFNQRELAAWSGMSREALVKGFRQLRALGWLAVNGRTLILLDPAALRRRANQPQ
jgi:CRP/FNR family transcriptional regulator, cyclic AMP receptor protein